MPRMKGMTTTRLAPFSLRSIAVPAFGPALLFSIYAAIGLWAALITRETWGKRERALAEEAASKTPQTVNA